MRTQPSACFNYGRKNPADGGCVTLQMERKREYIERLRERERERDSVMFYSLIWVSRFPSPPLCELTHPHTHTHAHTHTHSHTHKLTGDEIYIYKIESLCLNNYNKLISE